MGTSGDCVRCRFPTFLGQEQAMVRKEETRGYFRNLADFSGHISTADANLLFPAPKISSFFSETNSYTFCTSVVCKLYETGYIIVIHHTLQTLIVIFSGFFKSNQNQNQTKPDNVLLIFIHCLTELKQFKPIACPKTRGLFSVCVVSSVS